MEVRKPTLTFDVATSITDINPWLWAWLCVGFFALLKDSIFGGLLTIATPSSYSSQNSQAWVFHNTKKVLRCTNAQHQSSIMASISESGTLGPMYISPPLFSFM